MVMVGGEPLYGDPDLLEKMEPGDPLSGSKFAAAAKRCTSTDYMGTSTPPMRPGHIAPSTLQTALRHYGRNLAPLAECGQ